ncbi:hypothetical protein EOM09_01735 [bacterium]|nr:hypothetical protein [bacterium]
MKILYWGPNCDSGIEQIGFIYLLLLKLLGHEIDYSNAQSVNIHEIELKKLINSSNYDFIIFNEAWNDIFKRTDFKNYPKNKVYNICHANLNVPKNVICLSLNYNYHMRIANNYPIVYPLSYPFYFKNLIKKDFKDKKYKIGYIGRLEEGKFNNKVKDFLIKNNMKLDYCIANKISNNYEIPYKEIFNNLNTNEIYEILLDTKYLLLPSTTECISLVAGEAEACGCIPIVLENSYLVHEQFKSSIKCFNIEEFNNTILKIYNNEFINSNTINCEQQWHINRVKKQLELLFGKEKTIGKINLLDNGLMEEIHEKTLINAEIITGTTLI